MEGAVRLFAAELSRVSLTVPCDDDRSGAWAVTPTGAYCRQVFLAGALTELSETGDSVHARLADPTGGFDLACGGQNTPAAESLKNLLRPSFISVLGRVQAYRQGQTIVISIRPDYVRAIDRQARDQWVVTTAEATLRRLIVMRDVLNGSCTDNRIAEAARHYQVTPKKIDELAMLISDAAAGIQPPATATADTPDVRQNIIDILKAQPGPRGVPVQEIIDTLAAQGIFQDIVLKAIEALIVEDECYQPQKGNIRLL